MTTNTSNTQCTVTMRTMTAADIPLGMRLKSQAGWNQTLADWNRFITLSPQGCFVASADVAGKPADVGTAATFVFGNVGWIAMILVDPATRGKGVGSAMMNHCLAYLTSCGVQSIRLDATDLGKPVYDKLGFVEQFKLVRYEGTLPTNEPFDESQNCVIRSATVKDHDAIKALDLSVMRTDRSALLDLLLKPAADASASMDTPGMVLTEEGELTGYCLTRRGAKAAFIGPCVATSDAGGNALLQAASQTFAGQRVLIDIPASHNSATAWAKANNLSEQRQLTRMCKGTAVLENVDHLWASSGPEKG